jgi:signal transduction histidine kinase
VATESDRRVVRLQPGDHVCLLHEGSPGRAALVAPFFRAGRERGARCLLIGAREDLEALAAAGLEVAGEEERGGLVLLERLPRSQRPPGALLDLLRQAEQQALDDGFKGLVVAGELVSAFAPGDLARDEALLGRFLAGSRTAALCLYDRARLSPGALADLLRTHPLVALDGELCPSPFAEPPELVESAEASAARAGWMLSVVRRACDGERLRAEAAARLVEQEGALERADRARNDFLAMLAHELRNPMGTISNAIQVLRLRGHGDEYFERALDAAERQVRHQAALVDDLLEASRVTRGQVELRREPFDLVGLVREVAAEQRSAFGKARLRLALQLPAERLVVDGDRLRLAQALSNLLRNAVKFTPEGGRATVRVRAVDGRAEVSVRDTGAGISADLLPHVFEVFAQGEHGLDRAKGGLGVGLAVVKGLVELHGGEVVAESAGPGLGAELTLRLPLAPDPAARALAARRPLPRALSATAAPAEPRRILVVEDNPDAASSLREFLELSGHEVELALSGTAGVEAARLFHPEVVLCDLGLPGMDGFEVAAELRRDPTTASAQLIAVTGYGREEDRRRSKAAGFDLHLTKPVDPARLRQVLQHH